MSVRAIPQADGSVKYIDDNENIYTPEEIHNIPHYTFTEKIGNAINNATDSFVQYAGRNLNKGPDYDEQANWVSTMYNAWGSQSADENARAIEAGQILGQDPSTFAGASREMITAADNVARLKINSPDDWTKFVQQYPATANYLSKGKNMAMSHDDIANLSSQEDTIRIMADSYELSTLNQERSDIGNQLLSSFGTVDSLPPEDQARLTDLDNKIKQLSAKMPQSTWSVRGLLSGLTGMIPTLETGLKYAAGGAATGAAIGGAAGLTVGGVGAIPGAISGAITGAGKGFQVGFAKDFTSTAVGNTYLDEIQKGVSPTDAAKGAAVSGAGNLVLSTTQIGKLLKIPEGTGLKALGTTALEQGAIGAGMAATNIAAQKTSEGGLTNWNWNDFSRIAQGGFNMIPMGLAMALPGHAFVGIRELGNIVDNSKTAQRAPEAVATKINAEVQGTVLDNVAIPGRELVNYIQELAVEKPQEAQEVLERLKISPKELEEAATTAGDVNITLGDFEVLPKKYREALLNDVRVGDQPTYKELQEQETAANREVPEIGTVEAPGAPEQIKPASEEIGLTETKPYLDAITESKEQEQKTTLERQASEQSPGFQSKLASHLEEARKTIDQQLNESPLYQASDRLGFNLQLFGRKIKDVKDVAKQYISDKLDETQRAAFDAIAEDHGYTSGDALAKDISKNRLKNDEAKARLENISSQFKTDELGNSDVVKEQAQINEGKIKTAAIEAETFRGLAQGEHIKVKRAKSEAEINKRWADAEKDLAVKIEKAKGQEKINDLKQQLTDTKKQHKDEINALRDQYKEADKQRTAEKKQTAKEDKAAAKEEWKAAKEWLKAEDVSQRLARQAQIGLKNALAYAKDTLADKPVKESTAYTKYMHQARNAARQAEKEYRAGRYEQAAQWKDTEMVNHAMALESVKLNKVFNKQERYLKGVVSKKKTLFKTDENFNQTGSMLNRFGLNRPDYNKAAKSETLQQWSTRMDESLGSINIAEWLYDESFSTPYKDLSINQIRDLTDALKNIQKAANQENKSIAVQKNRDLDEIKQEQIATMNKNVPDTYKAKRQTKTESVKRTANEFLYSLRTFENVIGKLQGWKDSGPLSDFWIKATHERADLESNRINEFKNKIMNVWKEYSDKERLKFDRKFNIDELGISATKSDLLSIALNMGNEGNKEKLLSTKPIDFTDAKEWNENVVMRVLTKYLDKKDWQTVQNVWNLVNELWPDLSRVHAEMTGFEPEKVESLPFTVLTPKGELLKLDGGYYPLKRDSRGTLQNAEKADTQGPLYNDTRSAIKATTRTGATKERTSAQYAISLDLSTMNGHIVDVIHDIYFRDLVADYRRVLADKNFQSVITAKLGPEGLQAFADQVANVANGEAYKNVGKEGLEKTVNSLRKAGSKSAILFRVSTIVQNLANITLYPKAVEGFGFIDSSTAMLKYGLFNYIPKATINWKAARAMRENIYTLSPFMRDRRNTPDYSLNDLHSSLFGDDSMLSHFGFGLLAGADDLFAVPMWKQAYDKEFARTGDQKQAAFYADTLIKRVNGSGRKYDVAPVIRSKSELTRVMTPFYGFMNTQYNGWVREAGIASQGLENLPRFLGVVASRYVAFVVLSDLLSGKQPDKKDNPMAWWAREIASFPFQLAPISRDVVPLLLDSALGLKSYGYQPPVTFSAFENITNLVTKTNKYLTNKKPTKTSTNGQDVAEAFSKFAAYSTGIPDQFNAWFWNMYDYANNSMDPEWLDIMKRRPKKERKD